MRLKKEQNWFCRYPYLSNLILFLVTAVFTLFIAELALRFSGKIPGYVSRYSNQAFRPVNQLEVHCSFLTNDEGVFKANPNYEWSAEYQINSDGFRSIEFKEYETSRTKILFLGDSFTWGGSANPITNSFVDIVGRRGYLTFNTGIPGTGPIQYAYLAEKYVPLLKPNIVAVMFYMRNDIKYPDPMLPHKNLFQITNAGWLYAFDENGNYMSPQEAYDYYLTKYNLVQIKDRHTTFKAKIRQMLMQSVVGTYFWLWLSEVKWQLIDLFNQTFADPPFEKNTDHPHKENLEYSVQNKSVVQISTRRSLARIKTISRKHGARFMLFLILAHPELRNENNSIEHNLQVFEGFNPFIPSFLTRHDYMDLPNDHLNNSGHQKYAEFILKALESIPSFKGQKDV